MHYLTLSKKGKSYLLLLYSHYSYIKKKDSNLIWKLHNFNYQITKYVRCILMNQISRSSSKLFERENLKFVLYEEDEGFQVITSVKGNIWYFFYSNIIVVRRNVMLNNDFRFFLWVYYKILLSICY